MNNEVQIFNFDGIADVRTVEIDGEPWFVGNDVAKALGYSIPKDAVSQHVDEEDKTKQQVTPKEVPSRPGPPQRPSVVINESGMYSLIFGSKLESAKRFKRWVTAEVLPTIRKTSGAYVAPGSQAELDFSDPGTALDALERALEIAREQRARIAELEPPASSMRAIRSAAGGATRWMLWREAQERFGMVDVKQTEFNRMLMEIGVTAPFGPGSKFKIEPRYRNWSDDWQYYNTEYEEWRINSNPHFNEDGVEGVMGLIMNDPRVDAVIRSM